MKQIINLERGQVLSWFTCGCVCLLFFSKYFFPLGRDLSVQQNKICIYSTNCNCFFFQLELHKRPEGNDIPLFDLEGLQCLGSILRIVSQSSTTMDFSNISIQWFRVHPKESNKEIISGGTLSLSLSNVVQSKPHLSLF